MAGFITRWTVSKLDDFTSEDFNDNSLRNRFYKFVSQGDLEGCHIWSGSKNDLGYGWFHFKGKTVKAHRLAYLLRYGSISDDMALLHECDNPSCCNPEHLRPGTLKENSLDMYSKGRGNNEARGLKGSLNVNSKLEEEDVIKIKGLIDSTSLTDNQIGLLYSVNKCTISDIRHHRTWKHIERYEGGH